MHKLKAEKSELHITDIKREDKGRWVAAARDNNQTLAEWAIDALNRVEQEQTRSKNRLGSGYYDHF
jgi:dsDNA-binding SOS-regulon protein